jgi:hypothetical protein
VASFDSLNGQATYKINKWLKIHTIIIKIRLLWMNFDMYLLVIFLNTFLYNALTFLRADCLILTVYNLDPLQRLFPPISGSRQNSLASNWLPSESDPMSDFVETLSHVQRRSQGCFVDEEPYSRILSKTSMGL